jgi:hypothetical protein
MRSIFDLSKASPWGKKFLVIFFLSLHVLVTWLGASMILSGDLGIGLLVLIGGNFLLIKDNLGLIKDLLFKSNVQRSQDYKNLISTPKSSSFFIGLFFVATLTVIMFLIAIFK